MDGMDEIDRRLIALLRHDARRGVTDLAAELGLSRATIRARIARLEAQGEILGYAAIVRGEGAAPVRAMMLVEIEGRAKAQVIAALSGMPEVTAIHSTNGRWDLVVEIGALDLAGFDAVLNRVRLLPAIRASETNLLLATVRGGRPAR